VFPNVSATGVPDWVKNTVGGWAMDDISETEFVNAIEFLLKENIIQVSISYQIGDSVGVPDWVKNTAWWWATDDISETEFVNVIEFLIEKGIIFTNTRDDFFHDSQSWDTFDFGDYGIGNLPEGYRGLTFDGKYAYFAPYYNGQGRHGEVLRYDTTSSFNTPSSWSTFDPSKNGVGENPIGYQGATFDGRYVYFAPYSDNNNPHGEVLRYDTKFTP